MSFTFLWNSSARTGQEFLDFLYIPVDTASLEMAKCGSVFFSVNGSY